MAQLLLENGDRHVTAEELHGEAVISGISVSLATVYNTLHQFTEAGLLRETVVEPGRSYFDTNAADHHHFGLEFDTVIMMGVGEETFWGKTDEERSAYFVGISRAKNGLLLTVCDHRDKPEGAQRWTPERRPHAEFLGYAEA